MILSIANKIASIANLTPTKSSQPSNLTDTNINDNNTDTVPMDLEPQSDITTNTNTTTSTSSIEPGLESNPNVNDETDASNTASTSSPIKSILKPKTLSLEPKDIRARAKSTTNTPRKVQFTVVDGAFGGRGKTEYTRCPSRKSLTRRPLPPGHFDTDSDSTATETDQNPQNNSNFSLLDTLNSHKFCQNSRLIKLVRRKKKKKDREMQWLAMISPEIGYEGNKTRSRIKFGGNKSNPTINNVNPQNITANNVQTTQNVSNAAPKPMDNAMSNTMNNLLSMKAPNKNKTNVNRFKSPYKSPSASMSRGRRALYKAQIAKQNRMNNASQNKQNGGRKILNTPIVKGTPIVQKVTKMAAIRMASLDQINEDRDNGNDGDNDDDDDIMMNNNNGSVPPQDLSINNKKKTSSSELSAANSDKEERKDNSHENSPKQGSAVDIDIDHDQDPETLSDEMKTDDKNEHGNSLDIAYEDDEDDDLILDDLRNGTTATKSGATSNNVSIAITKPVIANINSLFMPKNKSDVTNDDHTTNINTINSNRNSTNNNSNPIPNTKETMTNNANRMTQVQEVQNMNVNEAMQSKSPSEEAGPGPQQRLNFNLTSPMRSAPAMIPASPQMIQPSATTSTATATSTSTSTSITTSKMSPMDFARGGREINLKNNRSSTYLEQHSFSVGLGCGNSNASYSRSMGTQTERNPCEIGIQVDMTADNMNDMENETPFVIMKDKPIIITTSTGSRFMRITDMNQIAKYQMIAANDEKEPEHTPELQQDQDPVNHFGSVSESENDEDVVMNGHEDKDKSPSTEPEAELVPTPEVVKVARAMVAANKVPQRELSPVIEEEVNEQIPDPEPSADAVTATEAQTDIDTASNATEVDSNQSEADKSNQTPPPEQRLQYLTLNIQYDEHVVPIPVPVNDENHGINAQINNNKAKNRAHLKRKYDVALASDNEQEEAVSNTEELPPSKEPTPIKRRKVTKTTKSKRKRAVEKRIKYQKKDLVWSIYEGLECPTIILSCFYDPNEKFYPSGYQILWLNFIDTEGTRKGQCSITEEPYTNIKSKITARQLEQRLDEQDFVDAAWNEIKKHRSDIHKKYKVSRGRLMKSTKPKKIKRKRRASVM